jgi:acyl-CoA thioester hydrolase
MSGTTQETNSPATAELQLLYSTTVGPEQIDALGHMNVRFYGVHALVGARAFHEQLGLPEAAGSGNDTHTTFIDLYTRHYFEQLEGAPLEVWGGVLAIHECEIQMYYELRNPELENFGATYVFTVQHQDAATHTSRPLTPEIVEAARKTIVDWPEHGQPRSIDLHNTLKALSLDEVRALNIDERDKWTIEERQCDDTGAYNINSFQDLIWGGGDISDEEDWVRTLENGDRMGFATMESRCSLVKLPSAGTRVQSYRATIDVTKKVQHEIFWVYDIDSGDLLCTGSFVDVAFNINTRSSVEIPDFERKRIMEHYHPELA